MLVKTTRGMKVSQRQGPLAFVTPSCPAEMREALMQLERLRVQRPELETLAVLYAELIATFFGAQPEPPPSVLTTAEFGHQLTAGVPLFRAHAPQLDSEQLLSHWRTTCQILAKYRDRAEPDRLYRAATNGAISPAETLRALFHRGPREYLGWLESNRFDVRLGASVLRFVALPVLMPQVTLLQSCWRRAGWPHGYCPACGSWPLLAESRGLEQFRWLRCGLCGSGWQVDRLFCPFCQSRDHGQLQDLFVEGEEQKRRLSVCDACRGFVPVISTLATLDAPALLVAELETVHLELIAIERGYSVPKQLDREHRFLALGDSYTVGEAVDPAQCWPIQLAERLRQAGFAIAEPQIVAKTGWTTGELIRAMDRADLTGPFDIVSVLIGVNNQYQGRAESEYERELDEILSRVRLLVGDDARRVIVLSIPDWGCTPFAAGRDRSAITDQVGRFNSINRRAAARSRACYVDVTSISRAAGSDPSLLAVDGLHYSVEMYRRWAALVFSAAHAAIASARCAGRSTS